MIPSSPARRTLLHRCAALILSLGICIGAFIYWSAPPPLEPLPAYEDTPLAPEDSRRYAHDSEVNFGKVGALGDKGRRMLARLGEPKPLAIAIIVISIIVSGGCFLISQMDPIDERR